MPPDSRHFPDTIADWAVFSAPAVFVVLWASGFIGAKLGMPYAEPMTFLTLRMALVAAVMAIIVVVTRPAWPSRQGVGHGIVAGLLVHGVYLGGVFVSIDQGLPAGFTALVVSLQPVLTSTLANRLLGEKVSALQWAGLGLGIVGVYLVVHGRTEGEAPPVAWIGATIALFGITIGTLYQKRFGGGIDWRSGFLIQYLSACALFVVGALAFETRQVRWSWELAVALAWLVFVLSLGAIWLLYFLIRKQAATRVVSLFYLTPPITALMAWALFGERVALLSLAGMGVCVLGVALVNWRPAQG